MRRPLVWWGLLGVVWGGVGVTYHFCGSKPKAPLLAVARVCPAIGESPKAPCFCTQATSRETLCPEEADIQEEQRVWQEHAADALPQEEEDSSELVSDSQEDAIQAAPFCKPLGEGLEHNPGCQRWARFMQSCDQGKMHDCVQAALDRWEEAAGLPKDPAWTVTRLQQLCDQPNRTLWNAKACFVLGQIYENKRLGADAWANPQEAVRVLTQGCPDQGVADSESCYELARLYEEGAGGPENQQRVKELMIRSCQAQTDQYPSPGCRWLGYKYAQELLP